ncbi:MAG: YtxH domain-containing protein [Elusimicrobia bacterium]|nr:YtxH domain-containing protein [Elusimicrobiota bacterium]
MSDTKDTCCETTNTSKTFYWLLAGVVAGAAAAVLLAPKSGRDTREQLGGWWRTTRSKLRWNRTEDTDTQKEEQEDLVGA